MIYLDRFLIASFGSLAFVVYYATPYDLVTKLWIIPLSIMPVLFPAFTQHAALRSTKLSELYQRSAIYSAVIIAPVVVCVVILSRPFLNAWLGPEFARNSTAVLQLLSLGILINSVAQVPYSAVQAMGRPDITAKLHLLELPFYVASLLLLLRTLGIVGAALAWTVRVAVDGSLLFWFSQRLLPVKRTNTVSLRPGLILWALALTLSTYLFSLCQGLAVQAAGLVLVNVSLMGVFWHYILSRTDKQHVLFLKARLLKFPVG
jgi:O-antigen/teichoic acid export membrane protein